MNDNRPTIRAITNDQVGRSAAVTLLENERSDASRCILRRRYSLYMIKLGTDSLWYGNNFSDKVITLTIRGCSNTKLSCRRKRSNAPRYKHKKPPKVAVALHTYYCTHWLDSDTFYYGAMLRMSVVLPRQVVFPSVHSSVTLRYRGNIGWNSWKIISRLISLTLPLSLNSNITDILQREHPKF